MCSMLATLVSMLAIRGRCRKPPRGAGQGRRGRGISAAISRMRGLCFFHATRHLAPQCWCTLRTAVVCITSNTSGKAAQIRSTLFADSSYAVTGVSALTEAVAPRSERRGVLPHQSPRRRTSKEWPLASCSTSSFPSLTRMSLSGGSLSRMSTVPVVYTRSTISSMSIFQNTQSLAPRTVQKSTWVAKALSEMACSACTRRCSGSLARLSRSSCPPHVAHR
mmetsp:Transcript_16538/g.36991  ORF Transcript_16538/g.36991 Transcript_16538/m.36991 type:complete len:221 (-) Transcript_16538:473-1135(-)